MGFINIKTVYRDPSNPNFVSDPNATYDPKLGKTVGKDGQPSKTAAKPANAPP